MKIFFALQGIELQYMYCVHTIQEYRDIRAKKLLTKVKKTGTDISNKKERKRIKVVPKRGNKLKEKNRLKRMSYTERERRKDR